MTLEAIARAYATCVELEDRLRQELPTAVEDVELLRADLHALLMDALRQANVAFSDRSEAAHIAFEITQGKRKIA